MSATSRKLDPLCHSRKHWLRRFIAQLDVSLASRLAIGRAGSWSHAFGTSKSKLSLRMIVSEIIYHYRRTIWTLACICKRHYFRQNKSKFNIPRTLQDSDMLWQQKFSINVPNLWQERWVMLTSFHIWTNDGLRTSKITRTAVRSRKKSKKKKK